MSRPGVPPGATVAALALGLLAAGCGPDETGGELHARRSVLQREVEGMRELLARLERGESVLPQGHVVVAIDDVLVQELLKAQLPLEVEADRYRVWIDDAEVTFRGSPLVTLRGGIALRERPELAGEVRLLGALEGIGVDPRTGTLKAGIAVDHLELLSVAGLENLVAGGTLDELARTIRLELEDRLPGITIPVRVQRGIELPAVTDGPVRIEAATMPLDVGVSQVLARQGRLWVAVRVEPGPLAKAAAAAPPAPGGTADTDERKP